MAKRRSGKRYRMTPRRRAALKKAQAASARKRRLSGVKSGLKFTGYVVGASAAAAATYGLNKEMRKWASNPAKRKREYQSYFSGSGINPPVAKSASIPLKPINGMHWIKL
jgi:hypothetical protein